MFANNPHIPSRVLYYGDVNPVEPDVALGCLGNKDKIKAVFLADANIFSNNSGPLGVKLTVDTPRHWGGVILCVLLLHIFVFNSGASCSLSFPLPSFPLFLPPGILLG